MVADMACGRESRELEAPTFGNLLRRLRDGRGVSRERLAFNAGVSASYITHLEKGERGNPTREVVEALTRYLDRLDPLSSADHRQLTDLAGLGTGEMPAVEQLRAAITPDMRRVLDLHRPNLAAYLDVRANVLAWNDSWEDAFPGVGEDGNMLRWFFGNELAARVLVDWEHDVRQVVRWMRGLIGRSGDVTGFTELLADLGEFPKFRHAWAEGGVAFAPHVWTLHLRNPVTGLRRKVYAQTGRIDTGPHPGHLLAILGLNG
ncbi:helix-turn-helix transcriptional regulator [Nocardia sp. NBC_01503]|uniref:helix-turn-helix domain-containing protein n=1 Tax=Nocardia sp. NBC_01503 TaxID=2975997 RepID=UPI002E7C09BB|nr:helix-turn-helix transcriptional regulator [Nocardia sp. NBC_01503]WTL36008.1 helix-turn-helix transcriptional regulator [Nocardia sp. NBC_01503]